MLSDISPVVKQNLRCSFSNRFHSIIFQNPTNYTYNTSTASIFPYLRNLRKNIDHGNFKHFFVKEIVRVVKNEYGEIERRYR